MTVGVCVKWVHQRPEVDLLTGAVHAGDERFGGVSDADAAALEWALRCGEAWSTDVVVVTLGPAGADAELRDALAVGATRAIRIDADPSTPSPVVAACLADVLSGCSAVFCGDYSSDRGSGTVPAFLAAHLGAAQALGLVQVDPGPVDGEVGGVRRLDGGRREVLAVRAPAVLSVEGSTARLRRAGLSAALETNTRAVDVVPGPDLGEHPHHPTRPYRPRARTLPAPTGATALERIKELTAASEAVESHGETLEMEPAAAADLILATLVEWGYLDQPAP